MTEAEEAVKDDKKFLLPAVSFQEDRITLGT